MDAAAKDGVEEARMLLIDWLVVLCSNVAKVYRSSGENPISSLFVS